MRYLILILLTMSVAFAEDSKPMPPEAQKAVDLMEVQINKARQECLVKLNKVIMDITKTGNLEAAMVVKAKETEIMEAIPHVDIFGDSGKMAMIGKWRMNENGNTYEYKIDGTIVCINDGNIGKWTATNAKLTVSWSSGWTDTFTFPIKNNALRGNNNKGMSLTLTKVVAK